MSYQGSTSPHPLWRCSPDQQEDLGGWGGGVEHSCWRRQQVELGGIWNWWGLRFLGDWATSGWCFPGPFYGIYVDLFGLNGQNGLQVPFGMCSLHSLPCASSKGMFLAPRPGWAGLKVPCVPYWPPGLSPCVLFWGGEQGGRSWRNVSFLIPRLTLTGLVFLGPWSGGLGSQPGKRVSQGSWQLCLHSTVLPSFSGFPVLGWSLLTCFLQTVLSLENLSATSFCFLLSDPVDTWL